MSAPVHAPVCGGLNEAKEATPEIQALIDQLHQEIKTQSGNEYKQLKAVSYRSQVVAGTNYFVKVNKLKLL
jgi:cystatin-A/B